MSIDLLPVVADSGYDEKYVMDSKVVPQAMIREAMNRPDYVKFKGGGTDLAIKKSVLDQKMNSDFGRYMLGRLMQDGLSVNDANTALGIVLTSLTYLEQRTYFALYIPTDAMELFKPYSIPPGLGGGIETIMQRVAELVGQGQRIATPGGRDVAGADVTYSTITRPVMDGQVSYSYNIFELMKAAVSGIPLAADKVMAAREAYMRHLNTAYLLGKYANVNQYSSQINFDPNAFGMVAQETRDTIIEGAFVNSRVPVYTLSNNTGWSSNTDVLRQNINELLNKVWQGSALQKRFVPDTILYPSSYVQLMDNPLTVGGTVVSVSVSEFLEKNNIFRRFNPGKTIKLVPHWGMDNIYRTTGNTNNRRRIMAFCSDAEAATYALPLPLQFQAPQYNHIDVTVYGIYRYSEVWWTHPTSAGYADVA